MWIYRTPMSLNITSNTLHCKQGNVSSPRAEQMKSASELQLPLLSTQKSLRTIILKVSLYFQLGFLFGTMNILLTHKLTVSVLIAWIEAITLDLCYLHDDVFFLKII